MLSLDDLNDEQRKAVNHLGGPAVVIAGAGSGKTRVLTYRIAKLIQDGVPAAKILACTFTRKAAGEMQERLAGLVGAAVEELTVGTIHSLCFRILREEWQNQGLRYETLDQTWQKRYIRDILAPRSYSNPWGLNLDLDAGLALGTISRLKNDLVTPQELARRLDDGEAPWWMRDVLAVYQQYEARKDQERKLDFDDMLLWCYQLLTENPAVLRKWQRRFEHVLVDEFQDTNMAQWEILRMLAAPENNLFVVGDDWQSVYGFRGAHPELIVNFKQHYPDAVIYVLDLNYRSTEPIVALGNRVIAANTMQYPKELKAHRGPGHEPYLLQALDEDHEAELVLREIQALRQEGHEWKDIAILYRTNAQSRAFEDALVAESIPYCIVGATGFYRRKEVKDLVAYLRVVADPGDEEAVKRVLNVPSRYLGQAFVRDVEAYASRTGCTFYEALTRASGLKQYQVRGAREFVGIIEAVRAEESRPAAAIRMVRDMSNYNDYIQQDSEEADDDRIANLDALEIAAAKFPDIPSFLKYVAMMEGRDTEAAGDRVQLLSIHRAKGLEWPAVFVTGVSDGLLPHARAEDVEEERRLCYVAVTRAKDRLFLSVLLTYRGKVMQPSPFLEEAGVLVAV